MKRLTRIVLFLFISLQIHSQTLQETLSNLSSDASKKYVSPVINAFGSNLNSGWVTKVPSDFLGFNVDIRLIGVGTFMDDADQTFSSSGNFRYTSEQVDAILANSGYSASDAFYGQIKNEILNTSWDVNLSGPTITGSEDEYLEVEFPGATIQGEQIGKYITEIDAAKGYLNELSILPSAAIQLNVGTVFGTNVAFRWMPSIDIQELGEFNWIGAGLIHNPGIWLNNPLPVDLAVGFFWQQLEVGDIFESTATQFGLYASKTFGKVILVSPYASLTTESSETSVTYNYIFDTPTGTETAKINFDLEGENSVAFTIGAAFELAVVRLNVDYKMATVNTLGAGLSFGF